MDIHLPIAEVSINVFVLLTLGGAVGLLSGMFGVGGGFLVTPLLIFIGIAAPVAVASSAAMVLGSSVSGFMAHLRRGNVDFKMGGVLLIGGALGSVAGAWLFALLHRIGQIDLVVPISYVLFLGAIGVLMLQESLRTIVRAYRGAARSAVRRQRHTWVHRLPLKMRFRRSKLYISAVVPAVIGFGIGVLSAIMGVGGGFVMVPAMIYLLGMPTSIVIGTSLFQITFVMAIVTFLHATNTQTVDIILSLMLLAGAAFGAQVGTNLGAKLRAEQLRGLLAIVVLIVAVRLGYGLVTTPTEAFAVQIRGLDF